MTRRRSGLRWGARTSWRIGPYVRRYSATVRSGASRAGWTSQAFTAGRLTANFTTGRWTLDTPGPGSGGGDIPLWILRAAPRWLTRRPSETRAECAARLDDWTRSDR